MENESGHLMEPIGNEVRSLREAGFKRRIDGLQKLFDWMEGHISKLSEKVSNLERDKDRLISEVEELRQVNANLLAEVKASHDDLDFVLDSAWRVPFIPTLAIIRVGRTGGIDARRDDTEQEP